MPAVWFFCSKTEIDIGKWEIQTPESGVIAMDILQSYKRVRLCSQVPHELLTSRSVMKQSCHWGWQLDCAIENGYEWWHVFMLVAGSRWTHQPRTEHSGLGLCPQNRGVAGRHLGAVWAKGSDLHWSVRGPRSDQKETQKYFLFCFVLFVGSWGFLVSMCVPQESISSLSFFFEGEPCKMLTCC